MRLPRAQAHKYRKIHRKKHFFKSSTMFLSLSSSFSLAVSSRAPLLKKLKIADSLSKLSIITQLPQNGLE